MKNVFLNILFSVLLLVGFTASNGFCQTNSQEVSKDKLDNFYNKVNDWFNEINNNLEKGINEESLKNKEAEIQKCLKENNLGNYKLKFDKKFQEEFLAFCGLARYSNNDFYKFSRFKPGTITLNNYWKTLSGNYKKFYSLYLKSSPNTNFANVEMPVKVLKLYLHR